MELRLVRKNRARHHFVLLLLLACAGIAPASGAGGRWELLQRSVGVSAMHMQLLHNDRVIIFDRTDFGLSNLSLPGGRCRVNPRERVLPAGDCTAHSAEYDVAANAARPLFVFTDTWCSSGTVAPDGTLVQTGGWNDGYRNARTMPVCTGDESCDWSEKQDALAANRWYATNQILPDGRAFIIGGRRQFSYEFYPKADPFDTSVVQMPFLVQTRDPEENNLYPFVHLSIDGNLFIFANNRAILLDYKRNKVVRTYPVLTDGDPRNYPSSGSSVLLPLKANTTEAEVLVCGGAPSGSYNSTRGGVRTFVPALTTCGRIKITDAAPAWVIETMPSPRVMGDMILLPNGAEVAIINGAADGTAGWESASTPNYAPVIYRPDHSPGDRFEEQTTTSVARLYHSSAVLLRDGRLLVGGSNPHIYYNFSDVQFPTELSLQAFSPEYLDPSNDLLRPRILVPSPTGAASSVTYGATLALQFSVPASARRRRGGAGGGGLNEVSVTMVAPSFTTHSFAMNQRLLFLEVTKTAAARGRLGTYNVSVRMPASAVLAPPGYYMVFVVNWHIPSQGIWVHIQ
ncbi:Aldehyde oxidase GLOX [Dichanthelium oligosanthes]|uniref:Aldehyde oxidase GLOX n=1 Tax=Dichanthelium oligosanthes TaxID=888268 RepID=A0A1E5USW6_9POAL|nr:Aldehyde oxidase GLOX [Dichanthelium oligosanthes]